MSRRVADLNPEQLARKRAQDAARATIRRASHPRSPEQRRTEYLREDRGFRRQAAIALRGLLTAKHARARARRLAAKAANPWVAEAADVFARIRKVAVRRAMTPEQRRAIADRFFAAHPGARSVYMENYRAKFHGRRSVPLSPQAWAARIDEFCGLCAYCLKSGKLTQDHVEAIARGSAHVIENLVPACKSCNSRKGTKGVLSMVNTHMRSQPGAL